MFAEVPLLTKPSCVFALTSHPLLSHGHRVPAPLPSDCPSKGSSVLPLDFVSAVPSARVLLGISQERLIFPVKLKAHLLSP